MMGGMDDLVQFLRDRYDETTARALAATRGPWTVDSTTYAESISAEDGTIVVGGGRWGGEASVFESTEDAIHIAEHNPVRVLAEIDAKREILRWHSSPHSVVDDYCADEGGPCTHRGEAVCTLCGETACTTVRLLALPYADRPEYRNDWRPDA